MSQSFARLKHALVQLNRDVLLRSLQPGLTVEQITSFLREAGLPSDPLVQSLYQWHDGTAPDGGTIGELSLFPGFYLLSLRDATLNYRAFLRDSRWHPGWLPVFADGGGDFYVVDLGDEQVGVVRRFRIDDSDHPIAFRDLADMIHTLAEAFEAGTFYIDDDGHFESADADFARLASHLNPGAPAWNGA